MTILLLILAIPVTLVALWHGWQRLRFFLHMFQLEGYKLNEYSAWLGGRGRRTIATGCHLAGPFVLGLAWLGMAYVSAPAFALLVLLAWMITFASAGPYRRTRVKKPLAFTSRLKRLIGTAVLLSVAIIVTGVYLGIFQHTYTGILWYLGALWLSDLLLPLIVALAALIMKPVEESIQNGFKRQARKKLASRRDLKIVSITGSYGKTSVKFAVAEVLRQRFNTLATPGSFNTPMGLCLVVNQRLRPEHQVAIMEMGIRYRGDMSRLVEVVQPDIAVMTSIGVAHLETMGSRERIAEEKSMMIRALKEGGQTVLNIDDPIVADMEKLAPGKVWKVSVEGNPNAQITARDIRYGPEGAVFTVRDDMGGEAEFKTVLLGRHNVLNVLLAVAVGRAMGLRLRQMAHAVERLEPVEHRLYLRKEGQVTIIDDAFNSNPVGARNAVEILGQFNQGRRVIVTPGMIELGDRQEAENAEFGKHIAANADLAVLVGPQQTEPIRKGLREGGFSDENVRVVRSLHEAQAFLKTYLKPGDVVLYENDLPDQFAE
jgi:UDP-N-acetylmuramoyl-tripeptide--D-alanyl-D-alanine ligase